MNSKQLISILVVVVLLFIGFYYLKDQKMDEPEAIFDEGGALTGSIVEEPGTVIEGFNADLIIDKGVPVTYSSWGSRDDKLARTVTFVSTMKTQELYDAHLAYLAQNGYTVNYKKFGNQSYIYAEKDGVKLSYLSISAPENVEVSITEVK